MQNNSKLEYINNVDNLIIFSGYYLKSAKTLLDKMEEDNHHDLFYPVQSDICISLELICKANMLLDFCKGVIIDEDILQNSIAKITSYNHNIKSLLDGSDFKLKVGIKSITKSPDNSHVNHYEIETNDTAFPFILLKDLEASRYGLLSNKKDMGFILFQENTPEDEKLLKVLNKVPIRNYNHKLIELLDDIHKIVKQKEVDFLSKN